MKICVQNMTGISKIWKDGSNFGQIFSSLRNFLIRGTKTWKDKSKTCKDVTKTWKDVSQTWKDVSKTGKDMGQNRKKVWTKLEKHEVNTQLAVVTQI